MSNPLVSVIITPKNAHSFVREAIRSVLASEHKELEIIISPADNFDYKGLAILFKDSRIKVLSPNIGIRGRGPAKNRAFWEAKGEYLCVLDADDLWKPDWLAKMLPVAIEHGVAFSATEHLKVKDRKVVSSYPTKDPKVITLRDYTTSHTTLNSLISIEKHAMWPSCFGSDAIREMLVLAKHGGSAPLVKDAVYQVRIHPESETLSSKTIDESYTKILNLLRSNPESLGAIGLEDCVLAELKLYFEYRRAVNKLYDIRKTSKDMTYYEYVRDSKPNPEKLGIELKL